MITVWFKKITSTLRGQLSLWYLLSVGVIITVFLFATSVLFWLTLQDQIDHHIHIVVNEAAQVVQDFEGEQREELLKKLVSAQGMTIVVLSPDSSPVLETNSPDIALTTEHQLQGILSSSSLYDSTPIHFTKNSVRFAAMPVQISAGKGILAVGYSTQVLYATFIRMVGMVFLIIVLLVVPLTFVGYKFLKKQLQPLEKIAGQAKKISDTSSLSKRIKIVSSSEELSSITDAFNMMLSQLESVFQRERDFFSDAAHTLKTPLAVLQSQIENSSLAQEIKFEMSKTINETTETIQDLLFLAKIDEARGNEKEFSLSELMTDLTELATTLGEEKKIKVTADIKKKIKFDANEKLLRRALSNIVHNAVSYNLKRGTIHLTLQEDSSRITIKIEDTGQGIKKSDQKMLFTRFFRGNNSFVKGSGLGLAIAKAVVKNLNGQISLHSTLNKGTVVTIVLQK